MTNNPETILKPHFPGLKKAKKIVGEASTREYYRLFFDKYTLMAMIFPEKEAATPEIEKVAKFTKLYSNYSLLVPEIKDVIDNHMVIQEDLGDVLVQTVLKDKKRASEWDRIFEEIGDILIKLRDIPASNTSAILDLARMKKEMDFFLAHFAPYYLSIGQTEEGLQELKSCLYKMVKSNIRVDTFAHRDFHTRNIMIHKDNGRLYLVDYQDSLVASPYYDLVSFTYDSYLDLKENKKIFMEQLQGKGFKIEEDLLYIAAIQRNIKALGTFGYQVMVRKNTKYSKYIKRTLKRVLSNPRFDEFFKLDFFRLDDNTIS